MPFRILHQPLGYVIFWINLSALNWTNRQLRKQDVLICRISSQGQTDSVILTYLAGRSVAP